MSSDIGAVVEKLSDLDVNVNLFASSPNLQKNITILLANQIELAKMLLDMGQSHLFEHWAEPGVNDEEKKSFFDQISRLDTSYPGGLASYIQNARRLLADSKAGKNPFDGFTPSVPSGEILTFGDDNFLMFEETGIKEARNAAFVLVAGGLGERLGYNGIKVALPSESTTGTCFLQHYIESILALQEASCRLVEGIDSQPRIYFTKNQLIDSHRTKKPTLDLNFMRKSFWAEISQRNPKFTKNKEGCLTKRKYQENLALIPI